jgi:hypothetical protein
MMQFRANYLYTSIAGERAYYQASFKVEEDPDDDADITDILKMTDSPYLLIQRQFESEEPYDDRCYIETHDENYIGHFRLRRIEFTQEKLSIEFDRATDNLICIVFSMAASEFEEASRVIKIMSGEIEPVDTDSDRASDITQK